MTEANEQLVFNQSSSAGDAEAISHLKQAIAAGRNWYVSLLEAIGLWTSAEEVYNDRTYRYLIDGEAFDWLLLAERLCETIEALLPEDEKNALLFHGRPPLQLTAGEISGLISGSKYCQYLNFFYGVTVEGSLVLAVQEEIDKERRSLCCGHKNDSSDEAYGRIYGETRTAMLRRFRQEKDYPHLRSITITELKEFTYWLFKFRLKHCEKARIASDTRKALDYLRRQSGGDGIWAIPVSENISADPAQ